MKKSKIFYQNLSFILSLLVVFSMATTYFAASNHKVDSATVYNWAVDAGFPREFLNTVDEDFLLEIYLDNVQFIMEDNHK